jgi:hypothetical protein
MQKKPFGDLQAGKYANKANSFYFAWHEESMFTGVLSAVVSG